MTRRTRRPPPRPDRTLPGVRGAAEGPLLSRCAWAKNPLAIAYHDKEWGVPVRSDRRLFEFLILEGAQAGLSWDTILAKRDNYRRAYEGFDPQVVSHFSAAKLRSLMADAGIVRNRLKIEASVTNARAFVAVQQEFGSFSRYLWDFVGGKQLRTPRRSADEVPTRTEVSDALSKDLEKRGFRFVGTTIMYAFMQAVGVVDDHTTDCFRHRRP